MALEQLQLIRQTRFSLLTPGIAEDLVTEREKARGVKTLPTNPADDILFSLLAPGVADDLVTREDAEMLRASLQTIGGGRKESLSASLLSFFYISFYLESVVSLAPER